MMQSSMAGPQIRTAAQVRWAIREESKDTSRPAAAAEAGPGVSAPAAAKTPRVVFWGGKWVCSCGEIHEITRPRGSRCPTCGNTVCRSYIQGPSHRGFSCPGTSCKWMHPAFCMPTPRPPPSMCLAAIVVRNFDVWPQAEQEAHKAAWKRMMRVVSWEGHWVCACGWRLARTMECRACGVPCLDAMRGACGKAACPHLHLPLDLEGKKKPENEGDVYVKVTDLSVMWMEGAVAEQVVEPGTPPVGRAGSRRPRMRRSAHAVLAPPVPAAAEASVYSGQRQTPTETSASETSVSLPLVALDFQTSAAAAPAADDGYDDMLADLGVAPEAPAWRAAVMTSVTDELSKLAAPGLSNEAGEYNCFLNVVVQCLWHCFEFRKRVMSWPPELYEADPVVAALRSLFAAFADLEAEMEGGASADARRAVVDPAVLRHALAAYPGGSFGLGEMNDAAELLMTLYGCAQEVGGAAADAVDAVFGLQVRECVSCPKCRTRDGSPLETHQNEYVQRFFNVSATALRTMRAVQGAAASTAFLLRRIEEQTQKSCDTDHGGCDARLPVRHALTDPPAVFTLQLAWETTAEAPEDIRATMEAVQETVRLPELYADVQASYPVKAYKLRAAVAYYGAHYSALVYSPRVKGWVMLDDASVSKVGRWDDVVRKCQAGRIQPSVLFYEKE